MKLGEEIMTIDEMIDWLYRSAYRTNRYHEKIIEYPQYLTIIRWLEELKERREIERQGVNI